MIDLDRGVTMRNHPKGFKVCMYKDEPGIYYDIAERSLDAQIAKSAGFPTDKHGKESMRRKKLSDAMHDINAEFGALEEGAEIGVFGDYRVVYHGEYRFALQTLDGVTLDAAPMSKTEAIKLAKQMAAADQEQGKHKEDDSNGS